MSVLKKNKLPLPGLGSRTIHLYIKMRKIRGRMGGIPASYSIGPSLKPRLKTSYNKRGFHYFPQNLRTNVGIIYLISTRPVPSVSCPIHFAFIAIIIQHYIISATVTASLNKYAKKRTWNSVNKTYTEHDPYVSPVVLPTLHGQI